MFQNPKHLDSATQPHGSAQNDSIFNGFYLSNEMKEEFSPALLQQVLHLNLAWLPVVQAVRPYSLSLQKQQRSWEKADLRHGLPGDGCVSGGDGSAWEVS